MSLDIYVPRDERFGHIKLSDFLTYALKSIVQFLIPEFQALFDSTPDEFDSFEDVMKLYEGGIKLPQGPFLKALTDSIPLEILKEIIRTDGEGKFKFPTPQVLQGIYNYLLRRLPLLYYPEYLLLRVICGILFFRG